MRISLEIIEAVKKSCGEDYPIIYKFSPTHLIRGGRELEEGIKMAKFLEDVMLAGKMQSQQYIKNQRYMKNIYKL